MPDASRDEILFVQLVATFQFAAMQQMGKIANPVNGEMERDLDQARMSIDIVQMLQRKSEGHRSARESEFLDKVLFELQMNYVDEVKRGEAEQKESGDDAPEK
jgi:hypothetical protein